jgi:transposase
MKAKENLEDKSTQELLEIINNLQKTIENRDSKIQSLEHRLALALQARFAKKSEKLSEGLEKQLSIFDEAILPLNIEEIKEEEKTIHIPAYQRKKKGRKSLPKELPRIQKIYDLSLEEKICQCGCQLTCIGEVTSEQLDYIPAKVTVIEHVRKKYACKKCEETMITAKLPKQPIPKSIATPGLLAHIAISKYDDHLPLYRQEEILQRHGVDIPRMTLSYWMIRCGELTTPLIKLMHDEVINYDIAYADETPVQVLSETKLKKNKKCTMWLFIGGPPDKRCYLYRFHTTRGSEVAVTFFQDYKGYLHVDGYSGYLPLFASSSVSGVGCMAHARRKFYEITQTTKTKGLADVAISIIAKLYEIESYAKDQGLTPDEIYLLRQEKAQPILNHFNLWLLDNSLKIPPQSPIGKAVAYTLRQWPSLTTYLNDGRLEIDNNRSERGIKPFVVGRKNWMFLGNVKGANASANLFSLIESAKANNIEPYAYLRFIFEKLPLCET